MTQEDVIKLRSNALKKENKTGYPHLDLSHLQFYSEEELANYDMPDITMYALLYERITKNHFNNVVAMEYFGRKITYEEFLNKINEYASAFTNMGIKKGEVVSICSPNMPEVFYSIYALNKIGAVVNLIDPRNNLERIKQYINQSQSTRMIMLDIVYPKIEKIIKDTKLEKVYTISASDSLPLGLNYIQSAKTLVENHRKGLPKCPKTGLYEPLVKKVSENKSKVISKIPEEYLSHESVKDRVAIIINTSGTTGSPKGVMLTNENFNAIGYNYINTSVNFELGDSFLGIMPCFLAYGMGLGTHMPFILGLKNIIIPSFKPEDFPKLILKYKPNHFAGVPDYYRYLMQNKRVCASDLSFIKNPCAGGDTFDPDFKKKVNDFLNAHNCPNNIRVGWGLTEGAGMASSQYYIGETTRENELISVGIPALYNGIKVVSIETGETLKYNEQGELLLFGRGVMKGYSNNREETEQVIEEVDGERYLHTGDVGYVDENGLIYLLGRIKRIIVRPDGHNVFPVYIERLATMHPYVQDCVCVGLKDGQSENGRIPVAFLKLEPGHEGEVEQIIEDIKRISLEKLPERDVALDYIIIDEIPITENGKVNYKLLETYSLEKGKNRKRV